MTKPSLIVALIAGLVSTSVATDVAAEDATATVEEESSPNWNWRPVGSFLSRYEARSEYGSRTDFVRYRSQIGIEGGPYPIGNGVDLSVRFVPRASGLWHTGGNGLGGVNLGLHEGFMNLGFNGHDLQVGRFEMVYGDQLLIGPVGWHDAGRAFDGVRFQARPGDSGIGIDVFGSTLTEGLAEETSTNYLGSGDLWFFGVYATLGPLLGEGHALDVYALERLAPRDIPDGTPTTLEVTAGVRVKGSASAIDWRAEFDVQAGRHPESQGVNTMAYSVDGEVGATVGDSTTFRAALTGFIASGDDPETADNNEAFNHLFPTAHKWLGFMDATGARSNIAGGGLLLSTQPHRRWKAYVNTYEFHRLQDSATAQAGRLGLEVDAGFRFAIGARTGFRFGYGVFAPAEEVSDNLTHFGELELRTDF